MSNIGEGGGLLLDRWFWVCYNANQQSGSLVGRLLLEIKMYLKEAPHRTKWCGCFVLR